MVDYTDDGVKYVIKMDSSVSVLVDEDTCNQELVVKLEDEVTLEGYLTENVFIGSHFKGKLNNLMIQLCKNCNHPDLVESAYDGSFRYPLIELIVSQCSKFRLLERLLSELLAPRHNVLIKDFDDVNSELRIYLLSTRAGGLDINLTATDTCILYDN
ncbi:hypothetical protein BC332_09854 [Capsicum chinense]|nr:hypothetical protein BC332_09854 [Capsicum chinense]